MTNRIIDVIRGQDLTHIGTVDQGYYGLVPYVTYNGTTNYSHRQAGSLKAVNGLAVGGWFDGVGDGMLLGVWLTPNFCWRLEIDSSSPVFKVSADGTTSVQIIGSALGSGWNHVAARYTPSTEIAIFVNGVKSINVTSIPALLFNSLALFSMGGNPSGAELFAGKMSMIFVSHELLNDAYMSILYNLSKSLYGK